MGKLLSIKDNLGNNITSNSHIGIINPFRYRGYYYDSETELYYLNSSYYNPEWARFLNADGIIGTNKDIIGYNLYSYCSNEPVNNLDLNGYSFLSIAILAGALYVGVKGLITVSSNIYLKSTNKQISRDMFNTSMYSASRELPSSTKKEIAKQTQNTPEIKNAVKTCVEDNNKKKQFNNCNNTIEYKSGDLHYSLKKVTYNISGNKMDNGDWNITVTLSDTYDFTEFFLPTSFSRLSNDLGFVMQHVGMLNVYKWDVTYSLVYKGA